MKTDWYKSRVVAILAHIGVWAIVLSLPYLLDSHHGMPHHMEGHERAFFYLNLITNILWIGPFYFNAYWLTPRLFYHQRYLPYVLILASVFCLTVCIHVLLCRYVFALAFLSVKGACGFMLPAFILTIAIGTTFRVLRDKTEADQRAQDKQEENLKTELSFLRSQINPHFIFNILNNLVALEMMKSEELGPTILKLSNLMQYMLYETDEERVPLDKEVNYLQSYIDLQQQRFGDKVPITVALEMPTKFYEIEPMLLIPFVENAFKHGVGMIENPSIEIALKVKANVLHFTVRNRFDALSIETKDKTSGIGLGNVKRRLNLLYANQQVLTITRDENWFIVDLKINLH